MRDAIEGGAIILAALLVYTALHQISASLLVAVNIFSVAVILFGLAKGETAGALMGTACGLIVDSFSLGIFGIAGFAGTVTGFTTGYVSRKINVLPLGRLFVFIGLMGTLNLSLWTLFTSVFFGEGIPWNRGLMLAQPLLTAFLGTLAVVLYRKIKVLRER